MSQTNTRPTELVERTRKKSDEGPPEQPLQPPQAERDPSKQPRHVRITPTPSRTNLEINPRPPSTWSISRWTSVLTHHSQPYHTILDILLQGMFTGEILTEGITGGARELSTAPELSEKEASVFCSTLRRYMRGLKDGQWKAFEKLLRELGEGEWGYAVYVLAEEARRQLEGGLEKSRNRDGSGILTSSEMGSERRGTVRSRSERSESTRSSGVMIGGGEKKGRKLRKLIPPFNFCHVEDGLYRAAEPTAMNFPFIEQLQLRSVIWLDHDPVSESYQEFMNHRKITLHKVPLPHRPEPWHQSTLSIIVSALEIAISKANLPILICCKEGYHLTGIVVGCLRRLQGWNLSSCLEEYRRFSTEKTDVADEVCIEFFEVEGVKVRKDQVPPWIWLE